MIKYTNHYGESVEFGHWPLRHSETDVNDIEWTCDDLNGRTVSSRREARDYTISAKLRGGTAEDRQRLDDIFEADTAENIDGTLTVRGWSLRCRRTKSSKGLWWIDDGILNDEITLHAARPVWERSTEYSFLIRDEHTASDLKCKYPHGWPYAYPLDRRIQQLDNPSISSCGLTLRIFGACADPYVIIGGNRYGARVTLAEGERLEIDTRHGHKTAIKISHDGTQANVFDALVNGAKGSGSYAFEPIARGKSDVTWPGTFAFDVVVHEERSMPAWS